MARRRRSPGRFRRRARTRATARDHAAADRGARRRRRPGGAPRLIALDEAEVFLALGLDARVNTTKRYDRTRAWSLALHGRFPAADGIRFSGRKAGKALNYCLFLDRCGADLDL